MGFLLVFLIAILVSLFNVFHVFWGAFKTPPGHFYLWIGHYYADYFLYLQGIAQAARGSWLVKNLYATDDFTQMFMGWGPDIFLGKLAGLFHLSPILAYWLAVIVSSFLFVILVFLVIYEMLKDYPFYYRFSSLLLYLFSTPFYKIKASAVGREIIPYDFWYTPGYLFKHLGATWRHSFGKILVLLIILVLARVLERMVNYSLRKIFFLALGLGFLLVFLLTFFPEIVPCLLVAILCTGFIFALKDKRERKKAFTSYLVFLGTILVSVLLGFLAIRFVSAPSGYVSRSAEWWLTMQIHPPLPLVLLATGPILLFCPFGLLSFLRKISPSKLLIFFLTLASYFFFFSPIAAWFGSSNVRFLHSLITILFGVMAVLGMEKVASLWPAFKKQFIIGATILLLLVFIPANINFLYGQLNDGNLFNQLTYLPEGFKEGFLFLNSDPDKLGVLTSPKGELGVVLPVFAEKRVYLGRAILTPMFEEKTVNARRFYQGQMDPKEAREFLDTNNLGFVIFSIWDGDYQFLSRYQFLKPVFQNQEMIIFKAREE